MNREQALQVIGLDENATPDQAASACKIQSEQLAARITSAPTPALRHKYEAALDEIAKAASVLGVEIINIAPPGMHSHDTPLSQTQLHDLPSSTPLPTMSDSKAAVLDDLQSGQQLGLQQGQVLAGRYEIRRLIGMGGMGAVYSAFDSHLDEEIAIKVLTPSLLKNEQARERFMTEARTSARLSHPNIVNVHDVQREGELFFITMELLRGKSLRQEIESKSKAGETFGIDEVKAVARAVGEALTFAHGTTIHRDVKPENIWIGSDGNIKLMDFGIARVLSASRLTHTAMVMGTAYYMAPEQLHGSREVNARADQYALAVVLYEMLTGRIPAGRVKSAHTLRPDVPENFSAAIDKALESDPDDRFESIPAFLAQLGGAASMPRRRKKVLYASAGAAVVVILLMSLTPAGGRVGRRIVDVVRRPPVITDVQVSNAAQKLITVKWNNEPPNATKLVVLRSDNSREGFSPVGEVDPGVKSYTDTRGIDPEKTYYYKVIARNTAGKYAKVTNTPPLKAESLPQPPPLPSQFDIARKGTQELELTWKGKYPAGTVATLLRSSDPNGEFAPIAQDIEVIDGENRYTDTQDLKPGTDYYYRLIASYRGVASPAMHPKSQRTLPEAPEKPEAKPEEITQSTVKLAWPNDYKPGTTMRIERSELKNSNYEVITQAHDAALGVFEDSVEPKKQYFYKLTAVYDTQPSAVTGPIEVMTKPPQPGALKGLRATARDGKVVLAWAAAADPSITYRVRYLSPETNQYTVLADVDAEQTSYEHAVPADKDLKYEVIALNSGVESAPATITVPATPKLAALPSDQGAVLEWTPAGAASNFAIYRVDVSRVPEKLVETSERMFVDSTAKPGTEYDYFVSAISATQGASESPRQKVAIPLAMPRNVRVVAKDASSAEIAWEKSDAATLTGYEIERTDSGSSTPVRFTVDRAATTYLDTGLTPGMTYAYKLSALGGNNSRSMSSYAGVTMGTAVASAPAAPGVSKPSSGGRSAPARSGGASRSTSGGGGGKQTASKAPARATPAPAAPATEGHATETPCPDPTPTPNRTPRPGGGQQQQPPKETPDPRVTTPPFGQTPRPPIKVAPTPHHSQGTPQPQQRPPQQQQIRQDVESARALLDATFSTLQGRSRDREDSDQPARRR
jgi:fibronectin type 3 domain-containing protein